MDQNALTVVVPIKQGQSKALKDFLDSIGKDIKGNHYIRFTDLTTTHFARWVVIDADARCNACLAFESNYDGPLDNHLDDLILHGAGGLDKIYSYCEGYPPEGTKDKVGFKQYMRDHAIDYAAFYIAYRGLTVQDVRNDAAVRAAIEGYLDGQQASGPIQQSAAEVYNSIRAYLQKWRSENPGISLNVVENRPFAHFLTLPRVATGAVAVLVAALALTWWTLGLMHALVLLLLLVVFIGSWAALLHIHELRDAQQPPVSKPLSRPVSTKNGVPEDAQIQNQLTHIVDIKPGALRMLTLRVVLWVINFLAKYVYNQGNLGGIPTIHFARWVILKDRRLLFFSNFDGSWQNYLGEFIDRAHAGLTSVWSNTVGFPNTRWLAWKGATDGQNFMQWTRDQQIPTQVWYSAHQDVTVQNILNNAQIRGNVERSLTPAEIDQWLARL